MTCVFNNPESMSFHGLGQLPCSGKDSTVKEQLLLFCQGYGTSSCAFCSKIFNAKQYWKQNSGFFFKEIPFSWTEESDLSDFIVGPIWV